jgi:hypothetical protein
MFPQPGLAGSGPERLRILGLSEVRVLVWMEAVMLPSLFGRQFCYRSAGNATMMLLPVVPRRKAAIRQTDIGWY